MLLLISISFTTNRVTLVKFILVRLNLPRLARLADNAGEFARAADALPLARVVVGVGHQLVAVLQPLDAFARGAALAAPALAVRLGELIRTIKLKVKVPEPEPKAERPGS